MDAEPASFRDKSHDESRPLVRLREFGSYGIEAKAVNEAVTKSIAAIAHEQVHQIIPKENVRRFNHGSGWISPASPEREPDEMKTISDIFEIRFEDIVEHDLIIISNTLRGIADNMAKQQISTMFEVISEVCDRTGNVVQGAERPFPEAFIESLEKVEFGVGTDGSVAMPSIFVAPNNAERMVDELKKQPPEYQARVDALIEAKKAAALATEAARLARFKTPR